MRRFHYFDGLLVLPELAAGCFLCEVFLCFLCDFLVVLGFPLISAPDPWPVPVPGTFPVPGCPVPGLLVWPPPELVFPCAIAIAPQKTSTQAKLNSLAILPPYIC